MSNKSVNIKSTKIVSSVQKATEILTVLAESEHGLGVTEISNKLNYKVSATYHLLNTLHQSSFIDQDSKTKKYRIGFGLFKISSMAKKQSTVASIAQTYLEELRNKLDETCNLSVLDGNHIVYIAQAESSNLLKLFTQLGARVPFYCTGAGKVMLSYKPEKVQDYIIGATTMEKYTKNTLVTAEDLKKEFASIIKKGYALDNEEREVGVTCVAAPVFDCNCEVIAAISIAGPTSRLVEKDLHNIISNVIDTTNELSHRLGYINKQI
ncbi:MAG: IclR family transcriptional regulator [Bacillota bacterium]|nr:IclR family transcriptional regulator [Bacillota bacterium]